MRWPLTSQETQHWQGPWLTILTSCQSKIIGIHSLNMTLWVRGPFQETAHENITCFSWCHTNLSKSRYFSRFQTSTSVQKFSVMIWTKWNCCFVASFGQLFHGCKTRKTYFLGSDTPPTNSGKLTERGSSPTYSPHRDESHSRRGVNKKNPKMNKSEQILSWCSPRCPTSTISTAKRMRIFGILSSDGCVDEVISSTHLSQIGLDHQWWLFTERIQRMGEQNVLQEDIPSKGIGIHQHVVDLTSQRYRCLKIGRPPTRGSYYMAPLVDGRNPAPVPVKRQLIPFLIGFFYAPGDCLGFQQDVFGAWEWVPCSKFTPKKKLEGWRPMPLLSWRR